MSASSRRDDGPHIRLQRYFEFCDYYRVKHIPEAVMAFRFPVPMLKVRLPSTADATSLLPVFELLCYDNTITSLDLQGARLGDAGMHALAVVIASNTTLSELNISYNGITEVGAVVLCRALERSRLQRLFLRGNGIGFGGAAALSRVIRRTRHLCYIDVSNCSLRVRGVHSLTDALIQRAQARMAKRLLQEAGAAAATEWGAAMDATTGLAHPHASAAAAAPTGASREAAGFGWLWGDPQHLLVTANSTLRTDWGSLAAAVRSSLRSHHSFSPPPSRGAAGRRASAGVQGGGGAAATGGASTTSGPRRRRAGRDSLAGASVAAPALARTQVDEALVHGAAGEGHTHARGDLSSAHPPVAASALAGTQAGGADGTDDHNLNAISSAHAARHRLQAQASVPAAEGAIRHREAGSASEPPTWGGGHAGVHDHGDRVPALLGLGLGHALAQPASAIAAASLLSAEEVEDKLDIEIKVNSLT